MNESTPSENKLTVVRLKDKELIDRLCERSRAAILCWLRERSRQVFWLSYLSESFSYYDLGRFLGIARSEKLDLPSVANVLAHHSPQTFRTFEARWSIKNNAYPVLEVGLTGTHEWVEVLTEAWEGLERAPDNLSEPAGKLLAWAQRWQSQNEWIHRAAIGRQAQLRGTSWTADFIAARFNEIQGKSNTGLQYEQKDDEFRLSFKPSAPAAPAELRHGPLNPVLTIDFNQVEFAELQRFSEMVYDWILAAALPADNALLDIWEIHDRATLFRCFPAWQKDEWSSSTLVNFLSQVALDHGLLWGYAFQDPHPWRYECCPKQGLTWLDVKDSIHKARTLPPLTERYGISPEAAALMKWFTTLRQKEWLGKLTPPLEDNLKTRIGIASCFGEKNLAVYFSMLAEELSEQTEWKVTVYPWGDGWSSTKHRLLVKRKPTAFQDVVRHVQVLGVERGKLLAKGKIEAVLQSLLEIT